MEPRNEIISIGKRMVREGLVASTWGNISLKLSDDQIYITPSGMEYEYLQTEDIVIVNSKGKILSGKRKPSSELLMHLEIYKNRPEIKGIVHTHSLYASAYAVVRKPIPPIIEDMVQVVGGDVEVAKYALPGTEELASNVVKVLKNKNAVLLANHGVVGIGFDLKEAYKTCLLVEKTARIGIAASKIGQIHELSKEDIIFMRNAYLSTYGQK